MNDDDIKHSIIKIQKKTIFSYERDALLIELSKRMLTHSHTIRDTDGNWSVETSEPTFKKHQRCSCTHEYQYHELFDGSMKCTIVGCNCKAFDPSLIEV